MTMKKIPGTPSENRLIIIRCEKHGVISERDFEESVYTDTGCMIEEHLTKHHCPVITELKEID